VNVNDGLATPFDSLDSAVRAVVATGDEAVITDNGAEVAVIISTADYERLHEHADAADALRPRDLRSVQLRALHPR